jgi:peptidoglycan/xylan/chitin deacetylase (PgdA/CDA1 family)
MPLSNLLARLHDGRVPESAVAVTLDDGYIDNFETASPLLSALGVPATFFVTSDHLKEVYEYS